MPEKKVCFADFELDFGRFQLYRAGQPVRLEGLPLQLLMFLVEHQGQLVTREQIADSLWGKDVFVDVEQGINTAIRKIRLALEDDSGQPKYLQTVVGRGYRFVGPSHEQSAAAADEKSGFSAEELGRAILAAAGLEPDNPERPPNEQVDSQPRQSSSEPGVRAQRPRYPSY
ncbi:MAG: winged helix-turn-helix domain-containing protein [Candidatus Sulfotelmatobacter sp.]